eukprot:4634440-Prymnesium_polylepis.1
MHFISPEHASTVTSTERGKAPRHTRRLVRPRRRVQPSEVAVLREDPLARRRRVEARAGAR